MPSCHKDYFEQMISEKQQVQEGYFDPPLLFWESNLWETSSLYQKKVIFLSLLMGGPEAEKNLH
jgi:hypothetical protein